MKTTKLFHDNVYLKECDAKIIDIKDDLIALDKTCFFPTGGGQSCDIGVLNDLTVSDVFEDEDEIIWHEVKDHGFTVGDEVHGKIDWARRFDNMQRHCGEHIMSGMWHREYGGVNRGFHMGDEYMTVDISFEDQPEFVDATLTWEMANNIEACTNEVIWENLPVITRRFNSREEAENLPLRKKLAIDDEISIVSVGSIDNPSDCVACCGTHPAYSGQVGLLKIYRFEKNKGMWRIYFEAGKRAMEDYDKKHEIIMKLGDTFSAGPTDLLEKVEAQEKHREEMKVELAALRKKMVASESESILARLSKEETELLVLKYEDLSVNMLSQIGKKIAGKALAGSMVLLEQSHDNILFVLSDGDDSRNCGKLVKENAADFGGKGGGSPMNARVAFPDNDRLRSFVEKITK